MAETFWVELTAPFFSCPVSFKNIEAARAYARRQRSNGAFRAVIYRLEAGAFSGVEVERF